MADEVNLQFAVPDPPDAVLRSWKQSPPPGAFRGFKLIDEAYNSLTFEERYYDWPQKLLFVTTLGFALIFKGFLGSTFRLTVRADAEAQGGSKVTVMGRAHPRTQRELGRLLQA